MNSTRGSHFHEETMTIIFGADDYTLRFCLEQVFIRMKILRLVLSCNCLTPHRIIIRDAKQFHAPDTVQGRDISFPMMVSERENTNPNHDTSARGCNFTGRPLYEDSKAASAI